MRITVACLQIPSQEAAELLLIEMTTYWFIAGSLAIATVDVYMCIYSGEM